VSEIPLLRSADGVWSGCAESKQVSRAEFHKYCSCSALDGRRAQQRVKKNMCVSVVFVEVRGRRERQPARREGPHLN